METYSGNQLVRYQTGKTFGLQVTFATFLPLFHRYHGNSDEVGCFMAARPFSRGYRYFEVRFLVNPMLQKQLP